MNSALALGSQMCLLFSSPSLFWFLWPTWSGIQFNIFRTMVPITTKQELLSEMWHGHTCAHVYTCAHTYAHIHTHVCIYSYIYTLICGQYTSTCTHIHAFRHTCTHKCPYVHLHRYTPACTCMYTQACIYTHMHKSTCIYTQTCPKLFLHIHRKHRVRTDKHH